ncbi:hypothetical protein, partial [Mesorhizobium sp.]
ALASGFAIADLHHAVGHDLRKPRFARFDPTLILAISDIVGHPTESAFRRRAGYGARLLRRDDDPLAGAAHTDLPAYQHRDIEGQRDRD